MSPVTASGTSRRGFLTVLVSLAGLSAACTVRTPEPATPEPELSDTLQPATSTTATTTRSTPPGGSQTATFVPAVPTASTPQPQATIAPEPMATATEIIQPATPNEESFVQYAFEMRRLAIDSGDQAYGAIIVKDDRVVGLGPSRVVINHDATAHAEMEAIRDASRRLGAADLSGCVMYSTSRPCHMCETASYWARITRMYYGPNASDAGAPQYSFAEETMITKSFRSISLLACLMLWSAGCAAAPPPSTPTRSSPPPTIASVSPTRAPAATIVPITPGDSSTATPSLKPTGTAGNMIALTEKLIQAAERGDTAAVQQLLQAGANINGRDARGRTPIMAATHGNRVDTAQALIEAGADINLQDNRLDNPLLYAGAEGLLEILKLAIDAKADTKLTNRFGGTALIPAAERGHVEIVNELLTRTDVDVNHVNNLGWTALLEAIVLSNGGEKHQQVVQLLVDHGADINIADKDGVTPLQHAQRRGFKEIERRLLAANARLDDGARARDLRLITAADQGNLESARQLLAQGASVHAQDDAGRTALIAAAYRNDLALADLLIEAGADVNAQDTTQQSAYLIATSDGYLELLKRTLQAGANVHDTDSYNGTGLIRAADRGHVAIIQELLKTDIKIDHVNRLGWTALLEAIILGDGGARHTEVVRLLVEAGADVNLPDASGVTPLAHAQRRGFGPIIEILQQANAR